MRDTDTSASYEIDRRLLEVLVCPLTRGPLVYDRVNDELIVIKPVKHIWSELCADHACWMRPEI